jgi:hypothetical protein
LAVRGDVEIIDTHLVDDACAHITGILQKTLFKGIAEVGSFILDRFFGGEVSAANSRNPMKDASYRALTARCETAELPVSRAWLNNAVNVAIRDTEWDGAWNRLNPTQKVKLLPVHDPKKAAVLAEKAVKHNLSSRDLQRLVAEELAKEPKSGRGRPPKNPILKALDHATRTFTLDGTKRSFRKADISDLNDEEARAARRAAKSLMEKLQDLVEKLDLRGS